MPHEEVDIQTNDGVTIKGWYVLSRNQAAVITYPGRHSAQRHAQFLARHGYGVLLVDRRGQGGSEGDPNSYGWDEHQDNAAAIGFLRERPEIDPDRIGGIGFSVGGEVLLETAATAPELQRSSPKAPGSAPSASSDTLPHPDGSSSRWSGSRRSAQQSSQMASHHRISPTSSDGSRHDPFS